MQDLSFPTRDWTPPPNPTLEAWSLFFFFDWKIISLQYCGGFCHTSTWISHGCTCVPPSWNPTINLAPHPIPLGRPRALALSALLMHRTCTGHLFYIWYTCFNAVFKSSYPRLLPHIPKVCSLHLCLFCCLAYSVVVTISLNSIYMC